jgi:hypothetical protein
MLTINIPAKRDFDERTETFIQYEPCTIKLEHSLISLQKWESKWHKSFLYSKNLTPEEDLDYVRCMCVSSNVDPSVFSRLSHKNRKEIQDYIHDPMTATTFSNRDNRPSQKIITAELIYGWMVEFGIPFECAKWHLNQLFTLINVCAIQNNPKKMDKRMAGQQRSALNKARRAKYGTSG